MKKIVALLLLSVFVLPMFAAKKKVMPMTDREYWAKEAYRLAAPVLEPMSRGCLQKEMQIEVSPSFDKRDKRVMYMECFGRLMAGISPWLALPEDDSAEGKQRKQLKEWALKAYANAINPQSPDCLLWRGEGQILVDASYIAESFIRAFDALWKPLDDVTKKRYVEAFTHLRTVEPPYTNWLLFSAEIESLLAKAGAQYDQFRVNTAVRKCEEWYVGDGWYADGQSFAFDYYSSYVFHAMYLETLECMKERKAYIWGKNFGKLQEDALKRCQKFSIILERFISPEGTFPVIGRSIPYRLACMQPLALMAWHQTLPNGLSNGQVRAALTKVMHRMWDASGNYNEKGYLTIGFCGRQPDVADWYTNNGSLYITSEVLLPLGLPADHPFWTCEAELTTQEKAFGGKPFPKDHALESNVK